MRIAPNMVSFSDPLLLPQVYHLRADKTPFYSTGIAGEVPPLLQIKDDAEHANKLRVLNPSVGRETRAALKGRSADQAILVFT